MNDEELLQNFATALALLVEKLKKQKLKPVRSPRKKGFKLLSHEALEIFKSTAPIETIAERYDVHPVTVYEIKRGRTWSKLTGKSYTRVRDEK